MRSVKYWKASCLRSGVRWGSPRGGGCVWQTEVAGRGGHVCGVYPRGPQLSRCGFLHSPHVSGQVHITLKLFPIQKLHWKPVLSSEQVLEQSLLNGEWILSEGQGNTAGFRKQMVHPRTRGPFPLLPSLFRFWCWGKPRGKGRQRERRVRGSHSEGRRCWSG